jgi:class 3 adenylate cyclase
MNQLPGGTVTFLFSDIEGSTRLLEHLGDRYADLDRDHRRILREELGRAAGQEVDTQGDAFFFSFARARDAVRGAVAAQRALAAHSWSNGVEVKVRMGLHTGEPTVGEEGYLGLDVVRAARICSAGHGGQILLSETTRALVGNEVPAGVEIRDLGHAQLKDVQEERVFLLALKEETSDFPPLKSEPAESSADTLAKEIQRRVHEDVLASFTGRPDPTTRLAKLAGLGLLALALFVAAGVVLLLLLQALL